MEPSCHKDSGVDQLDTNFVGATTKATMEPEGMVQGSQLNFTPLAWTGPPDLPVHQFQTQSGPNRNMDSVVKRGRSEVILAPNLSQYH